MLQLFTARIKQKEVKKVQKNNTVITREYENVELVNNSLVKMVRAGNTLELSQQSRPTLGGSNITKINKQQYMINSSGEIKEYTTNTQKQTDTLRKTIKRIRQLINTNFSSNDTFLTLTYRWENNAPMRDEKRLAHDMDIFLKRLRRRIKKLQFLYVVEPQASGAWHVHALIKGKYDIDYKALWEHGEQIFIEDLNNVDNVGAYLSAYLTNTKGKKGERLHFYPQGMQIYRHSRGIKEPDIEYITPEEAKKIIGQLKPDYQVKYTIETVQDEKSPKVIKNGNDSNCDIRQETRENGKINSSIHLYYNMTRNECQMIKTKGNESMNTITMTEKNINGATITTRIKTENKTILLHPVTTSQPRRSTEKEDFFIKILFGD